MVKNILSCCQILIKRVTKSAVGYGPYTEITFLKIFSYFMFHVMCLSAQFQLSNSCGEENKSFVVVLNGLCRHAAAMILNCWFCPVIRIF